MKGSQGDPSQKGEIVQEFPLLYPMIALTPLVAVYSLKIKQFWLKT